MTSLYSTAGPHCTCALLYQPKQRQISRTQAFNPTRSLCFVLYIFLKPLLTNVHRMLALKLHSPMYFLSHRIYSRWCFWQVSKHYINSNSRAIHKACQKQEQTLEKWIFGIILGVLFWTYICLSSFWQQIKLLQFCAYLQLLDADFFNRHCFWNCCTWFTSAISKITPFGFQSWC